MSSAAGDEERASPAGCSSAVEKSVAWKSEVSSPQALDRKVPVLWDVPAKRAVWVRVRGVGVRLRIVRVRGAMAREGGREVSHEGGDGGLSGMS